MTKLRSNKRQIDFVFPIAIFFIFTISALIVILFAAKVYQHTVHDAAINYNANTSIAYVREKIHQHDNGQISLGKFKGYDAIIMKEDLAGTTYATYIYAAEGSLRELFIKDGTEESFQATSGQTILEVRDFTVTSTRSNLFTFTCTDSDGNSASACIGIYAK